MLEVDQRKKKNGILFLTNIHTLFTYILNTHGRSMLITKVDVKNLRRQKDFGEKVTNSFKNSIILEQILYFLLLLLRFLKLHRNKCK